MIRRLLKVLCLIALIAAVPRPLAAQSCTAPEAVCRTAASVLKISSFEPIGSAVYLGDGMLVTNRHMLGDNAVAEVTLPDGRVIRARAAPTDYPGDLILLLSPELPDLPILPVAEANAESTLFAVGFDVGRDAVRVYAPGRMIAPVADTPLARLHHDARSLPGNSGGALVNGDGALVGIIASGGEGRNEAIPAREVAKLKARSSPDMAEKSVLIGRAYARCAELIDDMRAARGTPAEADVNGLRESCLETGNRQMMDLAAQALGMRRALDSALSLLRESYTQDPNAPNTLLSLAITYHLAGRFADEVPIIRRGLEILPDDPQLLRLALQAGIWGGDQALADEAMRRIETVIPQMAPPARRFYDNPPPPPKGAGGN